MWGEGCKYDTLSPSPTLATPLRRGMASSNASGVPVNPPAPPSPAHSRFPYTNELKPCSSRSNCELSHLQAPGVAGDLKGYVKRCQSRRFTRCNRRRSSQPVPTPTQKIHKTHQQREKAGESI